MMTVSRIFRGVTIIWLIWPFRLISSVSGLPSFALINSINRVFETSRSPPAARTTSRGCRPASSAGVPFSTATTSGCITGSTPMLPISNLPSAAGTMCSSTGFPPRSIRTVTCRLAFPAITIEKTSHVSTVRPSMVRMRSPGCMPAAWATESFRKDPTTTGCCSNAGTWRPDRAPRP